MEHIVTKEHIEAYCAALHAAERAGSTIVKYRRELNQLAVWLAGRPASQERLAAWKAALAAQGYAPCTINAMLAAANGFFGYMGWEIHLKLLKIQRRLFRDTARELSRAEYERLLAAAKDGGQDRLALLMETLCATGIRISELRYMTVEAAQTGQATIALKGKIRTILLSTKLCRKLLRDLLYEKRTRHLQKTGLARAETAVQTIRRRSQQGVSAQLPQAVCDDIL